PASLLDGAGIEPPARWDWERLTSPLAGREFRSREEFSTWLRAYLVHDVEEARAGNVQGPLKAALDVLRDLRNEIRLAVDHGGIDGNSYRDDVEGWYTPLNAFLSIGPPASRIEEMIALMDAGILHLTGPATQIRFDTSNPSFVAQSTAVPGPPVRAGALIEARLPEPDVRRTNDKLLRHLLATEQAGPYRIAGAARTITQTAATAEPDIRAIALASRETANPVVELVRLLTRLVRAVDPAAAEYVHRGSTSQDILDTGAMLIARRALDSIRTDLDASIEALEGLARDHRETPMAGRTLGLHAVPTTFGLKVAGWRASLQDARRRSAQVSDTRTLNHGGAAGTHSRERE
ncbi:lyase family protein, partial [Micromonospora aurantiaca]|uniref:lyase family protein n=1 Tax=Micromonospora aurantiaca (nom. illeg.) TaxID=47850 RepID=UPI00365892E2